MNKLFEYYKKEDFNPTYSKLEDSARLAHYRQQRKDIFEHKLFIPTKLFQGAEIIEFGPAGGENALISALWGATLDLVEPVEKFHATIRNYFNVHNVSRSLRSITQADLQTFKLKRTYDLVFAEGFVHTVGAVDLWTGLIAQHCKQNGLLICDMTEPGGSLIEVLQNRVCSIARDIYRQDGIETAKIIFANKWNSIPHTRSFESWAYDVLYNPYLDYLYLHPAGKTIELMYKQGCHLYSSWPLIKLSHDVRWVKHPFSAEQALYDHQLAALQLIPSKILGKAQNLIDANDRVTLEELEQIQLRELKLLCALDASLKKSVLDDLVHCHSELLVCLAKLVKDYQTSELARAMQEIGQVITSFDQAPAKLAKFFEADKLLGKYWGSPHQYLVFQRL